VLRLASEGKATVAIADALGLSQGTVRNYLSDAMAKLGAANRVKRRGRPASEGGYDGPIRRSIRPGRWLNVLLRSQLASFTSSNHSENDCKQDEQRARYHAPTLKL
jgi:DNA-binding NarL/FixJ family response regulator